MRREVARTPTLVPGFIQCSEIDLMHSGTYQRVGTVSVCALLRPALQIQFHFVFLPRRRAMNVNTGIHFVALCTLPSRTAIKAKQGRRAAGEVDGGGGAMGSERQQRWTLTPRE